ncbi:ABC transporter substrate-binding protein [Pedococcus sp. 5OH_020]|uniref:ABC transporter substrate-binding protein n=1 Tax=Pedococcus sp. 5OH_020 TaxID=2989814 RepID=UPI0022E9EE0A|nr:ABC transporter substrate-binding protein [Pedococcus sp. 5OH_020]
MFRTTGITPRPRAVAGLAAAGLALSLSACGGAKVGDTAAGAQSGGGASGKCGTFNLAVNAWVGYEADAAVVAYVAKHKLGCKVVPKNLDEQVSWQGFGTGEVDAILENWGHDDLAKKYITEQKVAQDAGPTGNIGVIGWYVPPFLAKQHPDILDWHNLNKYANLFATSESGGKGQVLDGDPGFVTNDAALVKNLGLDYKVVYAGSEAALITSFRQAEQSKKPMIGYFYSPQWFLAEVPLVKVNLPKYTKNCDAVPAKVACDYPEYNLNKVVSTKFAQSGSPAYQLVKNFKWTNEDQNVVARSIAQDKLSDEAAAKKWVDANPDKVNAWLAD